MADSTHPALDEANAIVSDLAYWVGSCDPGAALRMSEGFGAALSMSASMRALGSGPSDVALALAETAESFRVAKDAQHAGWLLLSVKVELLHLASSALQPKLAEGASELFGEVEEIARLLVRRGTEAVACPS